MMTRRDILMGSMAIGGAARAQTSGKAGGPAVRGDAFLGKHAIQTLPFDPKKLSGFSEKLLVSHHDNNYGGAVKNLNKVETELSQVGPDTPGFIVSGLEAAKLKFTNSMILHELYFGNLGGDEQVKELFRSARDGEYREVAEEARELSRKFPRKGEVSEEKRAELESQLGRLQKRTAEIATVDFFHGRGREPLEGLLQELAERLAPPAPQPEASRAAAVEKPRGRTWVTRTGIHVDRMASAWLIRRFIDPGARFKFVNAREYKHKEGELRFDMFDGEYTHKGELCTFEVLLQTFEITDAALRPIAEIVHDIDLKDEKYGRPATAGIETLINGIAMAHREDDARLARASAALDDLYEYFKRKRPDRGRAEES